ncbi:MAG: TIGR02281 family clan AA aspartic protease [Brachymonas sp.]|nr:TIGR02281 family clan AA aspartic protease [Brachymonas sp.]
MSAKLRLPFIACRSAALVAALGLAALPAASQSVALSGMMGSKPLLVVNGSAPKMVGVGETYMGVKVLSASGDRATVLSEGKRFTVRLGESPVNVGGMPMSAGGGEEGGDGRRIVLPQTGGGHFVTTGAINGKTVQFMVDTGATTVAMDVGTAQRIGLNYKNGRAIRGYTANGVAEGWAVKLNSVRVGGVTVHDVDAAVLQTSMNGVLLGNSFLNRFTMTRDGDRMVLERRY